MVLAFFAIDLLEMLHVLFVLEILIYYLLILNLQTSTYSLRQDLMLCGGGGSSCCRD